MVRVDSGIIQDMINDYKESKADVIRDLLRLGKNSFWLLICRILSINSIKKDCVHFYKIYYYVTYFGSHLAYFGTMKAVSTDTLYIRHLSI